MSELELLVVRSPLTGEVLAEVPCVGPEEVRQAVERGRRAASSWAARSFGDRKHILLRVRDLLVERLDEAVETIHRETGKPRFEALTQEVFPSLDFLGFYARRARRYLRDRRVPLHLVKTKRLLVTYRPLGVIGVISPWNYPFLLNLSPMVQALAAGNAVVFKPSEFTPLTGQWVARLFQDGGVPESIVQCVTGDGRIGAALIDAPVDKVVFIGSSETGRKVMAAAARHLIPVLLELGGKDAHIVCRDADLERAANGIVWGSLCHAGQACVSGERVYVHREVMPELTRRIVRKVQGLRQDGDEADLGPLTISRQREIVAEHVREAVARGARVLVGGTEGPGLFYSPTVLTDVDPTSRVMTEETFGPVIPLVAVAEEEEAVRQVNESPYGLTATVWCGEKRRGERLARRLQAGTVLVNDTVISYGIVEAPTGGMKQSGIGRIHGVEGLREFCQVQSVVIDRLGLKTEPLFWFPYGRKKYERVRRLVRLMYGSALKRIF